jgi:hypothetical protein
MSRFNDYLGVQGVDIVGGHGHDSLEILGVGGVDIVGQQHYVNPFALQGALPAAAPFASRLHLGYQGPAHPLSPMLPTTPYAYPAPAPSNFGAAAHAAHLDKQQQLARTQFLPAIFVGIDSGAVLIPAGATQAITTEPQVPVRVTKFVVASSCAAFFNVNEIKIARLDLLASASGVPAEQFIPNAETPPIEAPVLPAGSQIVVAVENVSGAPQRFRGGFPAIDLTPAAARII